jgi:uncharacterized membrane protein
VNRSLSTVVIAVLLAAFIVGHMVYGWNLYLTLGADGNLWGKTPFLFASVVWIVVSVVLLVFAWDLWKERKTGRKPEVMTLGKPQKE